MADTQGESRSMLAILYFVLPNKKIIFIYVITQDINLKYPRNTL